MGLLDDAIREHLDLKRRRGADPSELDQAEHEALGPVRRDPFDRAPDELQPAAAQMPGGEDDEDDAVFDDEYYEDDEQGDEDDWGDLFDDEEDEPPFPESSATGSPDEAVPSDGAAAATVEYDVEQALKVDRPPAENAGSAAFKVEEAGESEAGRPPAEELEDVGSPPPERPTPIGAEPGEPAQEDVLEETPEFLQDTPDHDRLWFEQRPPRDFDFDG
jgi:hypothetical protein